MGQKQLLLVIFITILVGISTVLFIELIAVDEPDLWVDKGDFIVYESGKIEISCKNTGHSQQLYLHAAEKPCRPVKIDGEPSGWVQIRLMINGDELRIVSKENKQEWSLIARKFHGIEGDN